MAMALEVQGVKKSYHMGRVVVPALRGVSFEVKESEFLTISGPSGSGKSTLLHFMGGLIGIFTGYGVSYGLAYALTGFIQLQQQDTTFQNPERQSLSISPVFSFEWTIAAFVFAVVICIIFGLYLQEKRRGSSRRGTAVRIIRLAKFIWLKDFSACNRP